MVAGDSRTDSGMVPISNPIEAVPAAEKEPPSKNGVAVLPSQQSDYWTARKEAVRLIQTADQEYVKLGAISALCKLLELEHSLPTHIIEQRTNVSIADERANLKDASVQEIARRYKEALG